MFLESTATHARAITKFIYGHGIRFGLLEKGQQTFKQVGELIEAEELGLVACWRDLSLTTDLGSRLSNILL